MYENVKKQTTRESGIELLKIFAMFIIVIAHMVQTLTTPDPQLSYQGYVMDISRATTDVQTIILLILRHFGVFGNEIFFICSAWFLLKSDNYKKKKWFFMFLEIWVVSVLILIITYVSLHGNISKKILIKSIFPTTFANNWYLTCYLLFYPLHTVLNKVIKGMNQNQLFRSTAVLTVLYIFLSFIKKDLFYSSNLILWITIYFIMAYMQKYLMRYADSMKVNLTILILNAVGFVGIILLTEAAGHYIPAVSGKMTHWVTDSNPFLIAVSIALFNIVRKIHFKSKAVNYISGLSLLIYIIHDNIVIRTYFRPLLWNFVYENYGYNYVIGWVLILAVAVFVFGLAGAVLYTATIKKAVTKLGGRLYEGLKKRYLAVEAGILKL